MCVCGDTSERVGDERKDGVLLGLDGVVVVARLGLDVPFASGMVERALAGTTALLDR